MATRATKGKTRGSGSPPEKVTCQVCGDPLQSGRIVWCQDCGTPHHHDCWTFAGQCSTFACGCPRFRDHAPSIQREMVQPPLTIGDDGCGWVGKRKVTLATPKRAPSWVPQVSGEGWLVTDRPHTRLDLDTPLEKTLQIGSLVIFILAFCIGFPKHGPIRWGVLQTLFPTSLLMMLTRMFVECTYVLDNQLRCLLYSRSIFGIVTTWRICDFDAIRRVGIRGERHEHKGSVWWTYAIMLELPVSRIQVSEPTKNFRQAVGTARCLAEHLGAELAEARPNQVGYGDETGTTDMVPADGINWKTVPILGRATWTWTAFFFLLCLVNYLIF